MPLYMDRHDLPEVTAEDVAQAHIRDLEIQDRYGVRYLTYWFDATTGNVFCLADAPSADAAEAVHRESHGLVAHTMIEVDGRIVSEFLGKVHEPSPGEPWVATAFRTILFTDMEVPPHSRNNTGTPGRSTSCGLTTGSFGTPYSDTAAPRWTMRATASWRRSSRS